MAIFNTNNLLSTVIAPVAMATAVSLTATAAQAADLSEADVQNYAAKMKQAANSKNVSQVSNLVADEALISLSRRGKTTSLDKSAYLNLLQKSWTNSSNYTYDISISNVVISGSQAKADVKTVESWVKDGEKRTFTTSSRATLKAGNNNAVLLRAVSQVTID
ncbi:hypothetical protein [Psychrobacter sp. FDAARGOS_221]|uniref:hypothetical protein n=1 Tax=Psychrobacter sp. FDAARGOS_221 TaxID=1975705 RepID=UPI000BB56C12|nr:hypothetical protein [Psychrobacter sp. FDAARGOS_221]PNK59948.1 hypothetical protein A6J60_002990 [Psychrobacter sp. FDAARGOS_221]